MNIPVLIITLYIGLLFAIGIYAKRRASTSAVEYQRAGNKLTTSLVMVSIVGLAIGGASTIGVSEQAFKVGLSAGWYTVAWAIGALFMGTVMIKKLRSLPDFTTLPELLERHYDKKRLWRSHSHSSDDWHRFNRSSVYCWWLHLAHDFTRVLLFANRNSI